MPPTELELRAIPKGRGVHAERIGERIGPTLVAACRITDHDDEPTRRRKLVQTIEAGVSGFPDDLRVAVLAAMGMQPGTEDMRFLDERVAWLCGRLVCSARTARRRIGEAISRLARTVDHELDNPSGRSADPDGGWYVESLRSLVSPDVAVPQSTEERRIVSTVNGLGEIVHRVSVPRPGVVTDARQLEFEVLHGGDLRLEETAGGHFKYVVSLPDPLDIGDRHEYTVQMRIPPGQPMVPHYLCIPLRRHDLFALRIRFAAGRLPSRVWRVDEAAPRTVDDRVAQSGSLEPNRFGEVQAEFRDLRIGFAYGVQWMW